MPAPTRLIVTCEHGGNEIPAPFRPLFRGHRALLASHRGFDAGALRMAQDLAAAFGAPLAASTVSRLLVDLNRSIVCPELLSEITRATSDRTRREILERHYWPYRRKVEAHISRMVLRGDRVVHISAHSFTPALCGRVRRADVGLLYDPRRRSEAALCARWQRLLAMASSRLVVRRNYPYRGDSDGFTTYLRTQFGPEQYAGIEIEINQKWVRGTSRWPQLRRVVVATLRQALDPS
jgi:predicted N-formylglutamate amidohydrolase